MEIGWRFLPVIYYLQRDRALVSESKAKHTPSYTELRNSAQQISGIINMIRNLVADSSMCTYT